MMIREFYLRFSSLDESSLLFTVLRRLSSLDEIANMLVAESGWVEWPASPDPTDPTDPTNPGMGLGPVPVGA